MRTAAGNPPKGTLQEGKLVPKRRPKTQKGSTQEWPTPACINRKHQTLIGAKKGRQHIAPHRPKSNQASSTGLHCNAKVRHRQGIMPSAIPEAPG